MSVPSASKLRTCLGLFLFTAFSNTGYGLSLVTTPSTVALSCNTASGPGAAVSIVVKPLPALTGVNTIAVTLGTLPAGVIAVTTPTIQTLSISNQAAGITYSINYRPGCVGATATTTAATFRVNAAGVADATVTVNPTVTTAASGLAASPSTLAISCVKNGSVYTPGPARTISVSSAAVGGTPFTVDTVTNPAAAWLTVTPTTGGTAGATALNFTVQAASGCGGFTSGSSTTTTVHLLNAPAPDRNIVVTLQVVPPSPLVVSPTAPKLTYTKGAGTAGYVDVSVTSLSLPAPFYTVDTTTLPIWLTVDATSGRVPKSIRFSSTIVADSLAPGTYSASIGLKVSGSGDLSIPFSLLITTPSPKLSVAEGTTRNISWTVGQPGPTPVITAISSDSTIAYVVTTGGTLGPVVSASQKSGLAYNFGTQIGVTFDPTVLAASQPGDVLTGTVTLSWGSPISTTVVTFSITVQSPGALLTGISPGSLPTAASGRSFTAVLTGTGFIPTTDLTRRTKVGVIVSGVLIVNNNISWTVVNESNIILTFTVPSTPDIYLPFSPTGVGGNVNLGVCNPVNGVCTVPTGTTILTIGNGPIVQVITSSASFIQVNPRTTPSVAPYDLISVFGTNFCTLAGAGCASNQVMYATPDIALMYPTTLSQDAVSATQRVLSVKFQTQGLTPTFIANANLLFATNSQINLLIPSALTARIGTTVDMVVSFGYGTGATFLVSPPFPVSIVATNPGIFTVGSDGQGQGAVLSGIDYSLIGGGNESGLRSTASDSDTVLIYVTGMGAPDSTALNSSTGGSAWSADCITPASYVSSLNSQTGGSLTTADGLIIQGSLLNTGRLSPCILSTSSIVPSVTVGGVAGTVSYAGWVDGSIAGLYQLNVKLPGSTAGPFTDSNGATLSTLTAPVQLPVVVTSNSRVSQAGVVVWVAPKLKVVAPTTLTGTVGTAWLSTNNLVVATQGTSPYRFAVTSGLLPSGLLLNTSTGAISGTPAASTAGTYTLAVTATDSANVPVKDSVKFTITIAGGLVTTMSTVSAAVFGTANASLTTATAIGGVFPYTYTITAPSTLPDGMTIGASTGVLGISALTPAGTYNVTVRATDSTSGTPLIGTATFSVVVALNVANTTPTSGTNGQINTNLTTVSATGGTGSTTYTLDATSAALTWLTIGSSTGIVSTTNGAVAGTRSITVTATGGSAAPGAASAGIGTATFNITIN